MKLLTFNLLLAGMAVSALGQVARSPVNTNQGPTSFNFNSTFGNQTNFTVPNLQDKFKDLNFEVKIRKQDEIQNKKLNDKAQKLMQSLHEGGQQGNGGEVVACRDSSEKLISVELLDVFEARILRGQKMDLGSPQASLDEKVKIALNRIALRDKGRAEKYLEWLKTFNEGIFWETEKLPATPDIDPSIVPNGCAIEQVAIQIRNTDLEADYNYGVQLIFNQPLWSFMNNDQRAALVVHEIVYHEALPAQFNSAEPIRYFTSIILNDRLKELSLFQYIDILEASYLQSVDIAGITVILPAKNKRDEYFYSSGRPKFFNVVPNKSQQAEFLGHSLYLSGGEISFYDADGALKSIITNRVTKIPVSPELHIPCAGQVNFSERNVLDSCQIADDTELVGPDYKFIVKSERYNPTSNMVFIKKGKIDWSRSPAGQGIFLSSGAQLNITGSHYRGPYINSGPVTVQIRGMSIDINGYISFNENLQITYFQPYFQYNDPRNFIYFKSYGKTFPIMGSSYCKPYEKLFENIVKLYANGELREFTIGENTIIEGRTYSKNTRIHMMENGKLFYTEGTCP